MIDLDVMTSDERIYICEQVSLMSVRQYFQKHHNDFSVIKPGFRAEKLSDKDTFSIFVKNTSKPFIASFLDKTINIWLSQIKEHQDNLVSAGYSEDEALLLTIPDSVFSDNCELYFKLCGTKHNDEYIRLFKEALSLRKKESEAQKNEKLKLTEKKDKEQLEKANKTIDMLREELSEKNKTESNLSEALNSAKKQLDNKTEELLDLQKRVKDAKLKENELNAELEHYRRLETYSDEEYVQDDYAEFQHISICQVFHDHIGQTWLKRLADVVDSEIEPFVLDESMPRYFDNRDRLFWRNGPDEDEAIGVWGWKAEQNNSDSTKDYVTSDYRQYLRIIRVIELPQCKSLSEVARILIEGVDKHYSAEKALYVCAITEGNIEGLLCSSSNMTIIGDKAHLTPSVFMLPRYIIKSTDVVTLTGKRFYRKINLGVPQSMYRIRTPYDVVKKMILARATVTALRENELSKKEAQKCRQFIDSIPVDTLIQELSDAYACSEEEAGEYVKGFIEHIDEYITGNDLEINTISIALARNEELVELCKKKLSEEWENECADRINEAKKRIELVEQEENERRQEAELLIDKKNELDEEIIRSQNRVEEMNQLVADVEEKTKDRIREIQQNVGEFVSHLAFITPFSSIEKASDLHRNNELVAFESSVECVEYGNLTDIDSFEEELSDNLTSVGYLENASCEMAQAISFCICNKLPIVIGSNQNSVSQCVAATIGEQKLTEIYIYNQHTIIADLYSLINEKDTGYHKVYLIHGVFDGYSNSIFNELLSIIGRPNVNAIFILSLQGVAQNMLFDSIWSNAFYIDGDRGFDRIINSTLHSFRIELRFSRDLQEDEYRKKRKSLEPFSGILQNIQLYRYAMYLAVYNLEINDSQTIIHQMIAVARSAGSEEQLISLFHENGIANGEELLKKYL